MTLIRRRKTDRVVQLTLGLPENTTENACHTSNQPWAKHPPPPRLISQRAGIESRLQGPSSEIHGKKELTARKTCRELPHPRILKPRLHIEPGPGSWRCGDCVCAEPGVGGPAGSCLFLHSLSGSRLMPSFMPPPLCRNSKWPRPSMAHAWR